MDLDAIRESFTRDLNAARTTVALEDVRVRYTGRKGALTSALKELRDLPAEDRKQYGKAVNELKVYINAELAGRRNELTHKEHADRVATESIDITLAGKRTPMGHMHPINRVMQEIIDVFVSMGFGIEEGPEVELDHYNFEALNIPRDHPARDMQDTFYISDDVVLRTHTSPVQIRVMEKTPPPVRFIAPGKVYRCDADVSHTPMFHQIEGLMVDEDITFGHLKGVLETFIHRVFTPETPVRFRPSFFPFTEPSAEVDMGCIFCGANGPIDSTGPNGANDATGNTGGNEKTCSVCKGTGWIEILGAGMVHPAVLEGVGYDSERYTGFAFGMGIERIAMLKYSIDDIRLFYENDQRFLRQF